MARPTGSKTTRTTATTEPSRCPACHSTASRKLGRRTLQRWEGTDSTGKPFDHIQRQRVQCTNCDQVRIDRSLIYAGDTLPDDK